MARLALRSIPIPSDKLLTFKLRDDVIKTIRRNKYLKLEIQKILNITERTLFAKLRLNHVDLTRFRVIQMLADYQKCDVHAIVTRQA